MNEYKKQIAGRAKRMKRTLAAYAKYSGEQDPATNLRDLLADLMHFADAAGIDWRVQERIACKNYSAEVMEAQGADPEDRV